MIERSVLIIDDEKRMADSLRDLLTDEGCEVETTYGGEDGIAALKRRSFPVVITDLKMQGVSGIDVMQFIHENRPGTLVILITGYASTDTAIDALRFQAFDYIRKPFDFDQLIHSVNRAFQKTEVDQLREDTAAMITHDIKTPLMSIIGYAGLIANAETGAIDPKAADYAGMIRTGGQRVLELIENYLTSCKVESGTLRINPRRVITRGFIEDLLEIYERPGTAQAARLVTEMDEAPETVQLDEPMMFRAVGNLINNAIKYGEPGEPVVIRARSVGPAERKLDCEAWRFEVINVAPGLRQEHLVGLFRRFTRASIASGIEGSGIGLYVVDAAARAHHGIVEALCIEGERVSFAMELPVNPGLARDEAADGALQTGAPSA